MFKRILLPTDFSETALRAQRVAGQLAAGSGATLVLVHVDEERALGAHTSEELIHFMNDVDARRKAWMEQLAADLQDSGATVELERLEGVASEQIIEYADRHRIDLIAMGALGHTSLKHLLLGSTGRAVLRQAHCPVVTVGGHSGDLESWTVKRLLFPTDFSPASVAGLGVVAALAKQFGASVDVMHVLRAPIHIPALPGEPPISLPQAAFDPSRQLADRDLEDLAERLRALGVSQVNTGVVLSGDAAEGITDYGEKNGIDLIVIPRHGRGGIRSLLFGRVAQHVVKRSGVPVLTFPPDEQTE